MILQKTTPVISAERLRELLTYDPLTGEFHWAVNRRGPARAGDLAGTIGNHRYWSIKLDGGRYLAHRLAWLYVHGMFPTADIDHINGCRTDNRITNLRDVCRSENTHNVRRPRSNSTTGVLGVQKVPSGRWSASIGALGSTKHLGTFDTKELAGNAYLAAKAILHPGFIAAG